MVTRCAHEYLEAVQDSIRRAKSIDQVTDDMNILSSLKSHEASLGPYEVYLLILGDEAMLQPSLNEMFSTQITKHLTTISGSFGTTDIASDPDPCDIELRGPSVSLYSQNKRHVTAIIS